MINDTSFIISGDRGNIFLSTDAGKSFLPIESLTQASLTSICFPDALNGWIVGQGGVILHSSDGGQTWELQNSGVTAYLMSVDFTDALIGCAVGANSTVIVTTDGGRTWMPSTFTLTRGVGGEYNLFSVKIIEPQIVCITGDMGRLFRSENFGLTWAEAVCPLYDEVIGEGRTLYAIAAAGGTLLAIGIDGTIVVSRDSAKTWMLADSGSKEPEYFSLVCVDDFCMAAGSGGNLLKTENSGDSWQTIPVPEKIYRAWLSGIALKKTAAGGVIGLVVGQYGTLGIINDAGIIWH
ncbi:MAG: hypothetical protein KJ737_10780 [Proteobacteria bacterium]|nr:hypothetical protein [Pseudomonadota bacterium]